METLYINDISVGQDKADCIEISPKTPVQIKYAVYFLTIKQFFYRKKTRYFCMVQWTFYNFFYRELNFWINLYTFDPNLFQGHLVTKVYEHKNLKSIFCLFHNLSLYFSNAIFPNTIIVYQYSFFCTFAQLQ